MNKILIIVINFLLFSSLWAQENLKFYLNIAIENNLQLNAERKNLESAKQNKKVLRSEFLPSVTISGDQTSTTTTNRTDQSGSSLSDTNLDTENTTISFEQKLFSGFKGINTFKKSKISSYYRQKNDTLYDIS